MSPAIRNGSETFRRLVLPFLDGPYQFRSLALDVLNGEQPFALALPKPAIRTLSQRHFQQVLKRRLSHSQNYSVPIGSNKTKLANLIYHTCRQKSHVGASSSASVLGM